MCHSMARFERRDDAFGAAERMKRRQRLGVGDRRIFAAARVLEPRVFVVNVCLFKAGRHLVRLNDLAIGILQQISPVAMQYARVTGS